MTSELDLLMRDFSEERKKEIYDKADRLEAYFNTAGVLMMKDKDEQWVEGMLDEGESIDDFTKMGKEGWDGNLPNDDARIGEGVGL